MTHTSVYWIHRHEHTDMFNQGYIGVSNNLKRRFWQHRATPSNSHLKHAITKYGWDNLIKEVVLVADRAYCLDIETKLRPTDKIGWNVRLGGVDPPISRRSGFKHTDTAKEKNRQAHLGKKASEETKQKLSASLKKAQCTTRFVKGQAPHNKGVPALPHVMEALKRGNTGRKHTEEELKKMSLSHMGRAMSAHTKERLRIANVGRKPAMLGKHYPTVVCPQCNKLGGVIPMKRWHFDNCRNKGGL